MPRFFVPPSVLCSEYVRLEGEPARHVARSLRMAEGDGLTLCDGEGNDFACHIVGFSKDTVDVKIDSKTANKAEPPYRATLFQCIAKGEKMDYIVQKSVELGVFEIVPVESERTIVRLDRALAGKKTERWQRISEEAACQCGRGIVPKIHSPVPFDEAVRLAAGYELSLFCYECEKESLLKDRLNRMCTGLSFFVGPEGGFSEKEAEAALENRLAPVSLGNRILRTESASGYLLSALSFAWEMR